MQHVNSRKKAVLLLVIFAVLSPLIFFWYQISAGKADISGPTSDSEGGLYLKKGLPTNLEVSSSSAPLPPVNSPLALTIGELKKRSEEGEPNAACRLAAEYSYCDTLQYRRTETSQWLADRELAFQLIVNKDARRQAIATTSREMDFREKRDKVLEDHCAGVPIPSAVDNVNNWRRAAILGNAAAAKEYASGNAFRWNSLMEALPQLNTFKAEAERMALQIARKGDIEMTLALAAGYSSTPQVNRSLLAQALKPDGAMSLALYRKVSDELETAQSADLSSLKRLVAAKITGLEDTLSNSDRLRATEISTRQLDSWDSISPSDVPVAAMSGSLRGVRLGACDGSSSSQ